MRKSSRSAEPRRTRLAGSRRLAFSRRALRVPKLVPLGSRHLPGAASCEANLAELMKVVEQMPPEMAREVLNFAPATCDASKHEAGRRADQRRNWRLALRHERRLVFDRCSTRWVSRSNRPIARQDGMWRASSSRAGAVQLMLGPIVDIKLGRLSRRLSDSRSQYEACYRLWSCLSQLDTHSGTA